jgi:pilus assembly protein CpaD
MSVIVSEARGKAARPVLRGAVAILTLAVLAGCADRHNIHVGAIPDDYRTNHPIMISEKEEHVDIPVGRSDHGITTMQKTALSGFLANYDRSNAPVVSVMVPQGAANSAAAQKAADDMVGVLRHSGVPRHRIAMLSYATDAEASPPIRVSYATVRAHVEKCGRWPDDLLSTEENRHYANFGCANQNNLAAQVANPADLLGPRKPTSIDAENRGQAIDRYKSGAVAEEFVRNSEINYNQ